MEQLERAVPAAVRAWARKRGKAEGREVSKGDLKLPYKNKDGSVSCGGVESALKMIGHVKGLPADVLRRAEAELERNRCKRRAAGGSPLDNIIRSLEEELNWPQP